MFSWWRGKENFANPSVEKKDIGSYQRELNQPDEKKAQQRLGGDVRGCGQGVTHVFPGRAKDTAQAGRQEVGAVKGLDAVGNGTNDGADKDEEEGSVHAHGGAREHRVANVVAGARARHGRHHEAADGGADDTGGEGLLPGLFFFFFCFQDVS